MAKNLQTPVSLEMAVYLTTSEVGELLRTPEETVRYWAWKGIGPKSIKVGRRRLYAKSDVQQWLEERAEAGGAI